MSLQYMLRAAREDLRQYGLREYMKYAWYSVQSHAKWLWDMVYHRGIEGRRNYIVLPPFKIIRWRPVKREDCLRSSEKLKKMFVDWSDGSGVGY